MSASSMMRRLTLFMLIVGFLVMESSSQPDPNVWEGLIDATVLGKASKLLEEVMPNFSKLFTDMPNLREMLSEALVVFGEASTYTQDPSKWNANLPAIMQNVINTGRVTRPVITGAVARTLNGVELTGVGSAMSKLWRIISSGVSTAEVAFEEAMSGVGIDAAAVGGGDLAFSFSTDEALAVLAIALS